MRRPMSLIGPSRHFVATPNLGRFRTEADMNRQARPAAPVANGPKSDIRSRRSALSTAISH